MKRNSCSRPVLDPARECLLSTPPWWAHTRTRSAPRPASNAAKRSIRCARSLSTARTGPETLALARHRVGLGVVLPVLAKGTDENVESGPEVEEKCGGFE